MGLPAKNNVTYLDFRNRTRIPEDQAKASLVDEVAQGIKKAKGRAEDQEENQKEKRRRKAGSGGAGNDAPARSIVNVGDNRGNMINSIGDNTHITIKTRKVDNRPLPAPDTIGANGHMVQAVIDKINELAMTRVDDRFKRGENVSKGSFYKTIRTKFYIDFHLTKKQHRDRRIENIVSGWNVNRYQEVIGYFDEKLSKTATGVIKGAVRKRGHRSPVWVLMKEVTPLLKELGYKADSDDVDKALMMKYGVTSHQALDGFQQADWIAHLESLVDLVARGVLHPDNITL